MERKSTLMNILSGLIRPDEGEIIIDGKNVNFSARDASRAALAWFIRSLCYTTKSVEI